MLIFSSRYNLKRRVASLPPLSAEVFAEKVLSAQATNNAAAAKASFEKSCPSCQKTYYSENAFRNHIASQKHRLNELQSKKNGKNEDETASVMSGTFSLGEPINGTAPTSERAEFSDIVDGMKNTSIAPEDPVSRRPSRPTHSSTNGEQQSTPSENRPDDASNVLTQCLFCNSNSNDLKLNVLHMEKSHGMFIPEQSYLVNLEGLLKYLYAKITQNFECLFCHKLKNTVSGIQTHMRDKGHCMIAFDTEDEMLEVGQFYDFSSTYSDDEDSANEPVEEADGTAEDQDGWETDSSTSAAGNDTVFATDYELHLPSGRVAGHRSLAKYYRQNLRNYATTPEERLARQQAIMDGSAENNESENNASNNKNRALTTRANGGLGMVQASESQKHEAKVSERRERNRENRARREYQWGLNRRANHQPHFRVSHLLFFFPLRPLLHSLSA